MPPVRPQPLPSNLTKFGGIVGAFEIDVPEEARITAGFGALFDFLPLRHHIYPDTDFLEGFRIKLSGLIGYRGPNLAITHSGIRTANSVG